MGQDLVKLLSTYSKTQKIPEDRQCAVEVFDSKWHLCKPGIISFKPINDTSIEITGATWGRFLQHMPQHKYTDFYRIVMDGNEYYLANRHRGHEDHFHAVLRPISRNTEGIVIDEKIDEELSGDTLEEYLGNKVYFTQRDE